MLELLYQYSKENNWLIEKEKGEKLKDLGRCYVHIIKYLPP